MYNHANPYVYFEFVCAETGLEKKTIKAFAHRVKQEGDDVTYEADFKVGSDFGEIGGVFVENEHHKEMFLEDILLDGFSNADPITIQCNSWVHSKYDNPQKRIFFTNKVTILNLLLLYVYTYSDYSYFFFF